MGKTGNFNGEDIMNMPARKKRKTAHFISNKLYKIPC